MGVQQGDGYWYVVGLSFIRHWDSSHQVEQFPLTTIIENELLSLGSQALVVMQQGLDILLGEVRMSVARLNTGEESAEESIVTVRGRHFDDI